MTKKRLVAVVSSITLKRDRRLATIVPLSTSPPREAGARYNIPLLKDYYWGPRDGSVLWAKCDMVRTVSIEKLDHLAAFMRQGQNHVPVPELKREDLNRIRLGVGYAIDLDKMIVPEAKQELDSYLKRFRAKFSRVIRRAA